MVRIRGFVFLAFCILGLPAVFWAYSTPLKIKAQGKLWAGVVSREITPSAKVKNWVTGDPYEGVHDPIYTRALVLSTDDQKVVIIHWELVDAGESATQRVREEISRALGIPKHNILVNASHNHSAPWSPVYGDNHRGKEKDTWWAVRYMSSQNNDPHFKEWMEKLIKQTVNAAKEAEQRLEPVTVWIGRADVSEYLRNRRPRSVKTGIKEDHMPDSYNFRHDDWHPNILSGAMRFGPIDRAMTVVSFRDEKGNNVGTLFHLSCHAVSMYPYMENISGDWPGEATRRINEVLGGQSIFLQGTAGDINPWRRGQKAVNDMARGLADYVRSAYTYSAQLEPGKLKVNSIQVGLPLTDYGRERTGLKSIPAEIQAVAYGSLAIVSLPGEPMTELGLAIRKQSPYPQTLVLGYSNGNGVHYVGMPGEKAFGGYEAGKKTNIGTDHAGLLMVKAAKDLLNEMYTEIDQTNRAGTN